MNFLYIEMAEVLIRGLKKGKHIEISHGIMCEGWRANGDRVSLKNPEVIMTTQPIDRFWKEVQTFSANEYSLKNTLIISNSDGGPGYSAKQFQEAFPQSKHSLLHQHDAYHVEQAIHKTFCCQQCKWKIRCARH